jgi:AcrR family transcriptional regulator
LTVSLATRLDDVYSDNMSADDNSVNIENAKARYHHGDLREALIEEGLKLLAERSADDLSLREVARRAGVSATAVYRHFPDKQAMLFALCERGARALGEMQRAAMEAAGGGKAGFDATGQAYVRLALATPSLFRLLMSVKPSQGHFTPDDTLVSEAMRDLRRNVALALPEGASETQRTHAAIHAWSLVHGLAMLMLDGQIPADEALIDSIASEVFLPG